MSSHDKTLQSLSRWTTSRGRGSITCHRKVWARGSELLPLRSSASAAGALDPSKKRTGGCTHIFPLGRGNTRSRSARPTRSSAADDSRTMSLPLPPPQNGEKTLYKTLKPCVNNPTTQTMVLPLPPQPNRKNARHKRPKPLYKSPKT